MRMQLALRNRMFYFFSMAMPIGFFFLYSGVFAKSDPHMVSYLLGPVLALNVMGSFWGLSAALVTFREQGILRRFHVTPVTSSDMLMSSVLATFVLTIPTVVVELLFARFVYHVPTLGDLLTLFLLIGIGTISFGSMGLVVASITNTMQETQVLNQLIWLPLIFLSGATLPLLFLPKIVQKIALFLPATYLVSGLTEATFRSGSVWSVRIALISLCVWAILTFFVSAQLFRWEPEVKIPRKAKLFAAATVIPFILLGVWELHNGDLILKAQSNSQLLSQFRKVEKAMQKSNQ
jgi:ABC-2 type transport system permease protein